MTLALALAIPWISGVVLAALDGRRRGPGALAVLAATATTAALCVLLASVILDGPHDIVAGDWPAGVGIRLRADALGVLFAVLSAGVTLVALCSDLARRTTTRTSPALVLLLLTGLTGLFLTGDVFSFYVFFELAMVAAYALTSTGGGSPRQTSAAFIFAVVNLLGSFLFLIGIGAIYHVTGTLDMVTIAMRMGAVEPNSSILIAVTLFIAFCVKLGLFPFHFWLPAVYTAARPPVAAILAGALANIGSYGLLRFGVELLPAQTALGSGALLVLGTASILYGAMQALSRRSTSAVLAYSAIGQAGYILIALAVGGSVGLFAAVLYAVINSLNKALLFLAVDVHGWLVGAAFAIGAFSVTGVPPSAGFFGKVGLFQGGIEAGSAALVALVFLGGALSFVYMFQIYQDDFWRPGERAHRASSLAARAPALVLAVVVLALGVWPEPLLAVSRRAADTLVLEGGR